MSFIISFLKKILLVLECFIAILCFNFEKILLIGIIAIDQFIKARIVANMLPGESFPVISDFFHITLLFNPGAAFGILPNQRMFFMLMGGVLIVAAAYFYPKIKKNDYLTKFGGAMLVGGAVSNLIDRVRDGQVVDFIDFIVWPIFNIADIAIVIGMFVLIYSIIFRMEDNFKAASE